MKARLPVVLALLGVYLIWGSTYLGMRLAIQAMPPLLMAGVRYLVAGTVMLAALVLLKQPLPSRRQWRHAGGMGILMLTGGNGAVCLALEQGIGSGLSALVLAITPLFALLMAHFFWRQHATGREWLGIALGIAGIVILQSGRELQATPLAGVLLIFASLSWSLGSIWGRHLDLPPAFMTSAVQMMTGGLALLLAAVVRGEALHGWPPAQALWALAYLIFVGAILGFSSYAYLLATVRPALATSYAYVNPLVAVLLGLWLGGEQMDRQELRAMAVILAGVVLVCLPSRPAPQA